MMGGIALHERGELISETYERGAAIGDRGYALHDPSLRYHAGAMIWLAHTPELRRATEEIRSLPDKASAIVAAAVLESILGECLRARVIDTEVGQPLESLFAYPHPLSAFSARIQMGQALGLYGPDTALDLNQVRKIRNACAHDYTVGTEFEKHTERTTGLVMGIRDRDNWLSDARERFLATVALVMLGLALHTPKRSSTGHLVGKPIKINGKVTPLP